MRFETCIGVAPGYGTQYNGDPVKAVSAAWQIAQEETWREMQVLAPAVIMPCHVVYRLEWGCPPEGEVAAMVMGNGNPFFELDPKRWKAAVKQTVTRVRDLLNQKTVTVYFWDGEVFDLRPQK